ncbi:MAG: hypothetical protein N2246_04625 [Candidatus Sumerlaeia bacterium]|nr:hypothetical protein [Candidatus Sumerlaeia bacterium]
MLSINFFTLDVAIDATVNHSSSDQSNNGHRTIINGNQAGSLVTFSGTELTTFVLSGSTITNGCGDPNGKVCV